MCTFFGWHLLSIRLTERTTRTRIETTLTASDRRRAAETCGEQRDSATHFTYLGTYSHCSRSTSPKGATRTTTLDGTHENSVQCHGHLLLTRNLREAGIPFEREAAQGFTEDTSSLGCRGPEAVAFRHTTVVQTPHLEPHPRSLAIYAYVGGNEYASSFPSRRASYA